MLESMENKLKNKRLEESKGLKLFAEMADWLDQYLEGKIQSSDPCVLVSRLKTAQITYQKGMEKELTPREQWALCAAFVFECLYNAIDLGTLTTPILMLDHTRSPSRAVDIIEYLERYEGARFHRLPVFQQRLAQFYADLDAYLTTPQHDPLFPQIRQSVKDKIGDGEALQDNLTRSRITREAPPPPSHPSLRRYARVAKSLCCHPILLLIAVSAAIGTLCFFLVYHFRPQGVWIPPEVNNNGDSSDSLSVEYQDQRGHYTEESQREVLLYFIFAGGIGVTLATLATMRMMLYFFIHAEEITERFQETHTQVRGTLTHCLNNLRVANRLRRGDEEMGVVEQQLLGDNLPPLFEGRGLDLG
jgi:hypothetical protein